MRLAGTAPGPGPWTVRIGTVLVGAASLWAQVMVVRAGLVAFGGNELVVSLLFGFWLASVGLGAFLGGALVRRWARRADVVLSCLLLLFAAAAYAAFFAARGLRGLVGLSAAECPTVSQIAAGLLCVTAPISLFVGLAFPFLAEARRARWAGAGEVYALEAVGSLAAGAAGTYLFLVWGRDDLLAFWAVAAALAGAAAFLRGRPPARYAYLVCLCWLLIGGYDLRVLKAWGDRLRWRGLLGGFSLVESAETPYGNLSILGRQGQYQLYLDGQLAFAFPDRLAEEVSAHVAATEAPRLDRIMVVGGPPGLVRELLRYAPRALRWVQFDPAAAKLVLPVADPETRSAFEAEPVDVVTADPRHHMRGVPAGSFDLILLALPEPSSAQLNRFYTVEFFREVKRALAEDGVVSLSLDVGMHLQTDGARYAATCARTLAAVFEDAVVAGSGTLRFFASAAPGVVTTDGETLARRFAARAVPAAFVRDIFFLEDESFRPARLAFIAERLGEVWKTVAPERDVRPTLFLRDLLLFAQKAGSSVAGALRALLALEPWHVLPWALLPGLAVACVRRRRSAPVVLAVGTTGLWAMSLELVILFTFQVVNGSLYHKVGMLAGAFMCGLSIGAWRGRSVRLPRRALLAAEWAAVAGAAATAAVPGAASSLPGAWSQLALYAWAAAIGAVTGFEFSAANLALGTGVADREGRSGLLAALTDGADHAGACVGALVTGLILLPCLGTQGAALFLAACKAGTLAGLWGGWRAGAPG